MQSPGSIAGQLLGLFRFLPPPMKREFYGVVGLMLLGAFAEFLAIGAVLPFLSLFADPARIVRNGFLRQVFAGLGATTPHEALMVAAGLFCLAAAAAGIVRLTLVWFSQAFVFRLAHYLGVAIQQRILCQSYTYHVERNTSEMLAALEKVQVLLFNVLIPLMTGFSSLVIAVFIVAMLAYIDPFTAVTAALSFALIYVAVSAFSRRRIARCSRIINDAYARRVQITQESLGGIRDILLDRSQQMYVDRFSAVDGEFRRAQALAAFVGNGPRFVIESVGMVMIALLAVVIVDREHGAGGALPVLGALALGAQRLLPLLQQVYYGWSSLNAGHAMVGDLAALLDLPVDPATVSRGVVAPLPFTTEIRFDHVTFFYSGRSDPVVDDLDIAIDKGSRVAFVGTTGSGKSTTIDLLMGLLDPTHGQITVDGRPLRGSDRVAWQAGIAHVPQSIFLADTSIEENIAFGVVPEHIDRERVRSAARLAQLDAFIDELPDGYATRVGERGVQLSGGQRQRLGISRALYKQASVLILDEATSALDDKTEAALMRSLEGLDQDLTIIMIAHRLSTVAMCDKVIRMEAGRVVASGTFDQVVAAHA